MKNSKPKYSFFIVLNLIVIFLFSLSAISKEIDIGLITGDQEIRFGSNQNATLINLHTNKEISKINKHETYTVHNTNGFVSITHNLTKATLGAFTGPVQLIPESKNGLVFCNKSWYRGTLILLTNKDKKNITVVNKLDLEDYLLSVVPSEIPNNWNRETLKAQSIAARSYALGYLGRRRNKGYDLESSVEDQVYLGVSSEKRSTSQAVKETSGIILVDENNKPLIALYHSSGGGYTDSIENLWNEKPSAHIKPRPDYDDNSPHFKWFRSYELKEANMLLSTLNIGDITDIVPLSRSISQRVTWIEIKGVNGNAKIRGEEFRKFLKLPSSKFNLKIENNYLKFAGRGFGHGLGLSQWGAKALAEEGFTYEQILAHYYPGARLVKWTNK
ncbi:MAG: SpoIID/LytB domain-containing protein [Candidatus Melainabacteria bacterium]|nr:SpoIID/LytB domain-containing protein [Candidatus Melainabacteria bacterium]